MATRFKFGMRLVVPVATAAILALSTTASFAGGFSIREQSVSSLGAAFAGNAAGGDLSSMYWNSAAAAAKDGMNSESHMFAILGYANVQVNQVAFPDPLTGLVVGPGFGAASNQSGDLVSPAVVAASYVNYQLTDKLYFGFGLNSPFGLTTKPTDPTYQGSVLGRTTRLLTFNGNPTVAYEVMPGLIIGAGAQIQYGDGKFKFATVAPGPLPGFPPFLPGVPGSGATTGFEGDGWAFGATAGILIKPAPGTSIGLGWRSQMNQELEGNFFTLGSAGLNVAAEAEIKLPDIVTFSFRHAVSSRTRIMGTVEWSHWSRFQDLTVRSTATGANILTGLSPAGTQIASLPANWEDGWFFSLGGEYDMNNYMTLRAGAAYEISPIDSAEKRFTTIPDNDRVWLSAGATVKINQSTEMDLAFTHILIEDGPFDRDSLGTGVNLQGEIEAHTSIIGASVKMKW